MANNFTIQNASNIPLDEQMGSIPNMQFALSDWYQTITFTRVVKNVSAFQLVETSTNISFRGIVQPLSGRQLALKPEGQRKWNWIAVYAQSAPNNSILTLLPDEVIIYIKTQYRIMRIQNYANYGYQYYELAEDYGGSGPPTL